VVGGAVVVVIRVVVVFSITWDNTGVVVRESIDELAVRARALAQNELVEQPK
jgi:hypothetical protein